MGVADRVAGLVGQGIARRAGIALAGIAAAGPGVAGAQALNVLPVTIAMGPGQLATSLTVINEGNAETSVQVRVYAWSQPGDADELSESAAVLASPPLATIAPHARQVVRLVLRQVAVGHEDTYRILLDQIPAPGAAGTVQLALRLSLPVFAQPREVTAPHLAFSIGRSGSDLVVVAGNTGTRHEVLRQIALTGAKGEPIPLSTGGLPYILAGAVRHWPIRPARPLPAGTVLRLTAKGDSGPVDVALTVGAAP